MVGVGVDVGEVGVAEEVPEEEEVHQDVAWDTGAEDLQKDVHHLHLVDTMDIVVMMISMQVVVGMTEITHLRETAMVMDLHVSVIRMTLTHLRDLNQVVAMVHHHLVVNHQHVMGEGMTATHQLRGTDIHLLIEGGQLILVDQTDTTNQSAVVIQGKLVSVSKQDRLVAHQKFYSSV